MDTISHPLLDKASEQFADPGSVHERIRAIDDVYGDPLGSTSAPYPVTFDVRTSRVTWGTGLP
ncbi:hypothetical protein [Streptosporangium sp. CA-115845]|uniref:hypothetical protein n=1 Tax=Streptosporangium sp. CA-115845 TaxID=3240071 RepID=UPI003D8CB47D